MEIETTKQQYKNVNDEDDDSDNFSSKSQSMNRKISKKKSQKLLRISKIDYRNIFLFSNDDIKLFADLSITKDGTVRLASALYNVSLGYYPTTCEQVELKKQAGLINLKLAPASSVKKFSTAQALRFLDKIPNQYGAIALLQETENQANILKKEISDLKITNQLLKEKDAICQQFTEYCFSYLKEREKVTKLGNIAEGSTCNPLFTYGIGRINLLEQDIEMLNAGYSDGFLELLGIDQQSLANIALRQKQIDLIPDKQDINKQSAYGLFQRNNHLLNCLFVSDIVTFDGFPIRLYQQSNKLPVPDQFPSAFKGHNELIFIVTEIDVETNQLQNLIEYRQKLLNTRQVLPIEIFIQRELSKRFEDVEYSIHSENFLDKYYKKNLESLKEFEQYANSECKYKMIAR